MALTTTVTENVKIDVMYNLGIESTTVYSQSFNRPNLRYTVLLKKGKGRIGEFLDDIIELINSKYRNQTSIIYTLSQQNCEQLVQLLQNQYRISAHYFYTSL